MLWELVTMTVPQRLLVGLSIQEGSGKVGLFSDRVWIMWPGPVIQSGRTFGFPPTCKFSEYTLPFTVFGENLLSETVPVLQLRHSSSVSYRESRGSILTGLTVA